MTATGTPYLQVDSVGARLRLYGAHLLRRLDQATYAFYSGDERVTLAACELRGSTGAGPPTRSVELCGLGHAAVALLHLGDVLLARGGTVRMQDDAAETFDVTCQKATSALFFGGLFLAGVDGDAFQCRLRLPDGQQVIGTASEGALDARRVLFVSDLAPETRAALARAVVAGARLVVEHIAWL